MSDTKSLIAGRLLGAWMSASAARMEATPEEFCDKFAEIIETGLSDAGYSIVKLDPLGTALDPYIEDNDHIDHDSGEAGDNCNRCVAEEAYRALGIGHPLMEAEADR